MPVTLPVDLDAASNGVSIRTDYHRKVGGTGGDTNILQRWYYEAVVERFAGVSDGAVFESKLDDFAEWLLRQRGKM